MSDITFVRTRYNYDSYTDFWRLVELSGFPFCYTDEVNLYSDKLYILSPMNGEWRPYVDANTGADRKFTSTVLLWNLERPCEADKTYSKYTNDNLSLVEYGYFDDILVSDTLLSAHCNFAYIPLGSHQDLGVISKPEDRRYDLIHLSCYSNYRGIMFIDPSHPKSRLYGLSVAPNGWGEARHNNLMSSKFMLNVHQEGYHIVEPLRFALAAAYGLPVISEPINDTNIYGAVYTFDNIHNADDFVRVSRGILNSYDTAFLNGLENNIRMTTEYSFRRCVESHI